MAGFMKREGIMLAYPAEVKRIKNFPAFEVEDKLEIRMFHQPKLNGERGRVESYAGMPYFVSSYGNTFNYLDKLQDEIKVLWNTFGEIPFDGEVYVHGWSRERIDSALRRSKNRNPDVDSLEYHIFDYQTADDNNLQYMRLQKLGEIEQAIYKLGLTRVKVVPYGICGEAEWIHHCAHYCEEGYEGIMLRHPFGRYTMKRSAELLKFKPKETDTYRIVAVNEALTSDTRESKGMVGSFTVEAVDEPGSGVTFDVGAGKLKHSQRIDYWNRKEECVGQMLLVKHELLRTTNQVPIAAVTVDIVW